MRSLRSSLWQATMFMAVASGIVSALNAPPPIMARAIARDWRQKLNSIRRRQASALDGSGRTRHNAQRIAPIRGDRAMGEI
jgi:hypothetical protein